MIFQGGGENPDPLSLHLDPRMEHKQAKGADDKSRDLRKKGYSIVLIDLSVARSFTLSS